MPQEIHVVQCYSCQMFQTDIVKQVNEWKCKFCGEKQSVRQVLFKGNGKDCRLHVQMLNDSKRCNDANNIVKNFDPTMIKTMVNEELDETLRREIIQFCGENKEAAAMFPDIDSNTTRQIDWNQFLPDESSN